MKILVVQDFLRSGGTERQSVLLAEGFASAGHATHLVTFRPGGPLQPPAPPDRLTIHSLQKRDSRLDWWAPGLVRYAKQHQPDIVLCMGRMANCYGGALQDALPNNAVVSTLRTGKPLPWLFKRSLQRTRQVIANSRAARDAAVADHGVPAAQIAVIHNALVFEPTDAASTEPSDLRSDHGASASTVVMLDVAMFRPEKNHIALVEILATLVPEFDVQLWLAGDGPALAACRDRASALGISDRVRFLGWSSDPKPFYLAADIAVHASRRESLSNFLIEAQAHGLPAVAYDALGVGETFLPGETGYLIPRDDAEAFRAKLITLIENTSMRERMGARARSFADENFSTQRQIDAYLERFQTLSNPPASP
ncbi:glycosyltransferase family 4 protein [Synoicihabitans lomoniglobus]|uniref:Glycosyltransferase family 4 protein n=1 Tax=Synoicihabitans lomoniglobus TaxID=2909285 RepID=A0AAF0CQP5_9BACT|nr:glycosyltransferase family 4 protein [Opitutaceae bacterium LMO-M01]WED66292.1 glycosyltransferase family 4 protein [Opitutaceae bacterium LMO-M01]